MKCDTCKFRFKCFTGTKSSGLPLVVKLNRDKVNYTTPEITNTISQLKKIKSQLDTLATEHRRLSHTIINTVESRHCGSCTSWINSETDVNVGFCKNNKDKKTSLLTHRYSTCDKFKLRYHRPKFINLKEIDKVSNATIDKDYAIKLSRKNGTRPKYCLDE